MSTRAEQQMAALKGQGFTVIGSYERREGETVVLIVCAQCGDPRTPEYGCPSCAFRSAEQKMRELRAALEQVEAGMRAARLLLKD